jgi:hypothetical protein
MVPQAASLGLDINSAIKNITHAAYRIDTELKWRATRLGVEES